MNVYPGELIQFSFTTSDITGLTGDADSLPTGVLRRNGSNTTETVTITDTGTGDYRMSFTVPLRYADRDKVEVKITATIDGVVQSIYIWKAIVTRGYRRIKSRMSCRTLEGYAVQLTARMTRDGRPVNLKTAGTRSFTVNTGTDVLTSTAHGKNDGDAIVFHTLSGVLPTGITAGTVYYIRDKTTDTFKIAATAGGSAIDITATGTTPYYWDVPTVTFTVREHGSGVAAFTKTLTAADIINDRFEGESPEGASFTVDTGTNVVTSVAHGLSDTNQIVVITGPSGVLPAPLAENTTYFVRDAATDTFKLALTSGGTAIDITTAGSGVFSWVPATAMLKPDRQYEVHTSMTLAGETLEDTSDELTIG